MLVQPGGELHGHELLLQLRRRHRFLVRAAGGTASGMASNNLLFSEWALIEGPQNDRPGAIFICNPAIETQDSEIQSARRRAKSTALAKRFQDWGLII